MRVGEHERSSRPRRAGVILSGGRSTRFGESDKAFAELDGDPMLFRVAKRLDSVTDELIVNCRADQRQRIEEIGERYPFDPTTAVDDEPDKGPLVGIETGLRATDADYVAVVACDMPFVDTDFLAYLFECAARCDAAVPRSDGGWYQTTQAVYRTEPMTHACERALANGERGIKAALQFLEYDVVEGRELDRRASDRTFENLNTRSEFVAVVDRLHRDPDYETVPPEEDGGS